MTFTIHALDQKVVTNCTQCCKQGPGRVSSEFNFDVFLVSIFLSYYPKVDRW